MHEMQDVFSIGLCSHDYLIHLRILWRFIHTNLLQINVSNSALLCAFLLLFFVCKLVFPALILLLILIIFYHLVYLKRT